MTTKLNHNVEKTEECYEVGVECLKQNTIKDLVKQYPLTNSNMSAYNAISLIKEHISSLEREIYFPKSKN